MRGELCTPTGAALLKYFADSFGDMPVMTTTAIGYGMGKKDFERANCVRAFLGETEGQRDTITKLECNIDDMTDTLLEICESMISTFDGSGKAAPENFYHGLVIGLLVELRRSCCT